MNDDKIANMLLDDDEIDMLKKFHRAYKYKKPLIEEMEEDFEFAAGKQWDNEDVETLKKAGVKALTINKIQPNIFLLSGIQRQNRTDFRAYPEGQEDSILAEIATKLLKNAMKRSHGEYKLSEVFEDGITGGEGDIEPTIDYTNDLVNGELRLKKSSPFKIFVDPDATEYDLSDAEYRFKLTEGLTQNQLIKLYPDKESKIKSIEDGKLNIDELPAKLKLYDGDYRDNPQATSPYSSEEYIERTYDLLEMEYKKYVTKYLVVDLELGDYKMVESKDQANTYADEINMRAGKEVVKIIKRSVPEVWMRVMVGNKKLDDFMSPYYPRWKSFSVIPFYGHRYTTHIKPHEYMLQGIVRSMKSLQLEVNKRRTQALRHLNSSTNSGWKIHKDARVDKNELRKYGATPSFVLEWQGNVEPTQIFPQPLNRGLEYMSKESGEDIKSTSGINADLLAMEDKTASGRAIYLRQQQGIVMVQRILDNFQHTKRLLGKFILSQLGELYSVETAAKVLGDAFIKKNFSIPVHEIAGNVMEKKQQNPQYEPTPEEAQAILQTDAWQKTGQPFPVMDERNEMIMAVDKDAAGAVINKVLVDIDIENYDISVGEAQSTETIKLANYTMLMDLIEKGVPIPPEILIDESMLANESKVAIKQAIERRQTQLAEQAQQGGQAA